MRPCLLLLALAPAAAAAQAADPAVGTEPGAQGQPAVPAALRAPVPAPSWPALTSPGGAFTASLVLPGAGQAALGRGRWIAYGLMEAGFWALHLTAAANVRDVSGAYRDLAWTSARLPTGPSERREGSWSYYETMGQYVSSGTYDRDPQTAGVQPEEDEGTYNGMVWGLARELFLPAGTVDPSSSEYQEALAYYRDRAAGPDFLWSWAGRLEDQRRYRGLIDEADAEARVRSTALGLVLANHLLSAVDAFLVARMGQDTNVRLRSRVNADSGALRWDVGLRISTRN